MAGVAGAAASVKFDCTDERATERLGHAIAQAVAGIGVGPIVMTFSGELGAGKTTLVRAVLRGLGHRGAVPSPTYMLLEPYELAGWNIAHLDFYRLNQPGDIEGLGLRDWLTGRRLILIEWPENAAGRLPAADVAIAIVFAAERRSIELTAHTKPGRALLTDTSLHFASGG